MNELSSQSADDYGTVDLDVDLGDVAANPVILNLHYRLWTIRQYRDGHWDACLLAAKSPVVTIGYDTFEEVMHHILASQRGRN